MTTAAELATESLAAAVKSNESHCCFGGILLVPLSAGRYDNNY